jgi:hypothetical protein
VLHDSVLEDIACQRPRMLEELESIKGIGPRKIEQFGQELLELVQGHPPSSAPVQGSEVGAGEAALNAMSPAPASIAELVAQVRWQIECFRQGGPEPDRTALMTLVQQAEILKSQDVVIAINALLTLSVQQAVPALLKLLDSDSGDVLMSAAEALGKLGGSEAIPRLLELLADERPGVRRAAARALGRRRAREALERLQRMAEEDPSDYVRLAAQAAVTLIETNS